MTQGDANPTSRRKSCHETKAPWSFRFKRSLDPVAVIALAIALVSGCYTLMGYFVGAKVEVLPQGQVEVRASGGGGWTIVRAQMSYVNTGRYGYDGIITSEMVKLEVPKDQANGTTIELHWQSFILPGYRRDESPPLADIQPVVVDGSGAVSHYTEFHPRNVPCLGCSDDERTKNYLSWQDLMKAIDAADRLILTFVADQHNDQRLVAKCYMPINEKMRSYMRKHKIFTRECVPADM